LKLFGFGKKKSDADLPLDFQAQGMSNYNPGMGQNPNPYGDSMLDQNSGLKLSELNGNQESGFREGSFDSFGNPRINPKVESFDYGRGQQQVPGQDNSKDLQLIIAKLDAIRSEITNINHRLDNIERKQNEPQQKKYPW
jgi:hypothetical protein